MASFVYNRFSGEDYSSQWSKYLQQKEFHNDFKDAVKAQTQTYRKEFQNASRLATMRGCEIKSLRWWDINLLEGTLIIPKSKTEAGERMIPLTSDAYEVLVKLRGRTETFGQVEPSHFVFASL